MRMVIESLTGSECASGLGDVFTNANISTFLRSFKELYESGNSLQVKLKTIVQKLIENKVKRAVTSMLQFTWTS